MMLSNNRIKLVPDYDWQLFEWDPGKNYTIITRQHLNHRVEYRFPKKGGFALWQMRCHDCGKMWASNGWQESESSFLMGWK